MKIAIASDHAGFKLKEALKRSLISQKFEVVDFGTKSEEASDYPDFGKKVGIAVSSGECERGVLVCGSGIGMYISANRFKGVRAAQLNDEADARSSRAHNDANVAVFGARKIVGAEAVKLLNIWLKEPFEGGRHERRVRKIDE